MRDRTPLMNISAFSLRRLLAGACLGPLLLSGVPALAADTPAASPDGTSAATAAFPGDGDAGPAAEPGYGIGRIAAQQALSAENQRLRAALTAAQDALAALRTHVNEEDSRLAAVQTELNGLHDAAARAGQPPASEADQLAYVAGQSLASGVRRRLDDWASAGMTPGRDPLLAGLTDGLKGSMRLSRAQMDTVWQAFSAQLQQKVSDRVTEGEADIAKRLDGHPADRVAGGITWRVLKKGLARAEASGPVHLALQESVAGGRVVSDVPSLNLMPGDDMPAVVRGALPLLGVGGEVRAWGLAKTVYGALPLPAGVHPFTVLEYRITSPAAG